MARRKKNAFPLLTHYLGDWRSLLPGGAAGVLQLMYPPLGAAVFSALGWAFWRWETAANAQMPVCAPAEAAALEPTERL